MKFLANGERNVLRLYTATKGESNSLDLRFINLRTSGLEDQCAPVSGIKQNPILAATRFNAVVLFVVIIFF